MNIFTGDLYSMYVVLQGIGSPSCMIIIYKIPFGEQQSWMSEVRKTRTLQQKNSSPEMINFFSYCIKNNSFSSSPKGTYPLRPVSENYEKRTILQWKLMELGGVPEKMDEYFHWGPIFYVCSSARNRAHFMYDYYIRNSLWSSNPGCLKSVN